MKNALHLWKQSYNAIICLVNYVDVSCISLNDLSFKIFDTLIMHF